MTIMMCGALPCDAADAITRLCPPPPTHPIRIPAAINRRARRAAGRHEWNLRARRNRARPGPGSSRCTFSCRRSRLVITTQIPKVVARRRLGQRYVELGRAREVLTEIVHRLELDLHDTFATFSTTARDCSRVSQPVAREHGN